MAEGAKSDQVVAFKNVDDQTQDRNDDNEPPRAFLALQPGDRAVAVAVGKELRIFDEKGGKIHYLMPSAENAASSSAAAAPSSSILRCIAFSRCGNFLAAGCDDKTARLWCTNTWECIKFIKSPKKISAVGFNAEATVMLAANKYGDVLATSTRKESEPASQPASYELLMGHFCSVITSLQLSHDGTLLATTDRDSKVRISVMPKDPLQGAHEIQSYGFGHTGFVSCSAFVCQEDGSEVLISGGGDGTLRMWDPIDGTELDMLEIGGKQENQSDLFRPVLAICPSQDGKCIVVSLDGVAEICVVSVDISGKKLEGKGRRAIPGLPYATDIARTSANSFILACGPLASASNPAAVILKTAKLDAHGSMLVSSSKEILTVDQKRELQKCNEEDVGQLAPQKMLPKYLHKRAFKDFIPREEHIQNKKNKKANAGVEGNPE